jgi:hypothetical protein
MSTKGGGDHCKTVCGVESSILGGVLRFSLGSRQLRSWRKQEDSSDSEGSSKLGAALGTGRGWGRRRINGFREEETLGETGSAETGNQGQ